MKFDEIIQKIDPKEDYTIKEVVEITGRSASCITAHIRRENIEARRVFNQYYIKGESLRNYLTGPKN